jgi:hypothetical protein
MALTAERRRPVPRKKRAGQHHKKNQRYLKHYWPYLPMLLIVGAGLLLSSFWPHGANVLGSSSDLSPAQLLTATNSQRQAAGDETLRLNNRLTAAAQAKANDMVTQNYWSHDTPSGQAPWSFVSAAGYSYRTAGENLAYGFNSSQQVMNGWMHSPEHRANVLNTTYTEVGFAMASSANYIGQGPETLVVAMYASPGDVTTAAATPQTGTPSDIQSGSLAARPVSRISTLSTSQTLLPMFVACLTGVAVVVFLTRHARFLHRSVVRGEVFVLAHPLFDIALVLIATAGFVLSQASGFVL